MNTGASIREVCLARPWFGVGTGASHPPSMQTAGLCVSFSGEMGEKDERKTILQYHWSVHGSQSRAGASYPGPPLVPLSDTSRALFCMSCLLLLSLGDDGAARDLLGSKGMGIGFNAGAQTDENRSVAGVVCACTREDPAGSTVV
jgi:hypothetical protein